MGLLNSYALLMPVSAPLPIVSIKIGYNGRANTVGRNERVIQEYIKKQLEEDRMHDQISMSEYIDPFTGIKNK